MSNKSKLIAALQRELEQVKDLSASALTEQNPSVVVSMCFIKRGFKHIQKIVRESSGNPWHAVDIMDAPSLFAKAGQRVNNERVSSDFLNFIRSVAHQLQCYDYENFADGEVMALINDMVDELDRIIVIQGT